MVEYTLSLDAVFSSLADPTRRDILHRLQRQLMNVTDIAAPYNVSLAAISKQLKILERANLIRKQRHGKECIVSLNPETLRSVDDYIRTYEQVWKQRLDQLDEYLQ